MSIAGTLFSFSGRSGRGGFWLTVLASILFSLAAMFISQAIFGPMVDVPAQVAGADTATGTEATTGSDTTAIPEDIPPPALPEINWTSMMAYFVLAIPGIWTYLAGGVKRAHDRGKSGWWMLLTLVPIIGAIWWLVDLGILEGQDGDNKYGPNPQGAQQA
jgi:uncharacterized membrane protein YhaH (DUF805 family)